MNGYSDTALVVVDGFNTARNAVDKARLMKMINQIISFAAKSAFLILRIIGTNNGRNCVESRWQVYIQS